MRHPHGLIGWADLMTTDVEAARTFYGALFDWTSTDMPTPMGPDYTQFFRDGRLVCGMAPMPPDARAAGMPSMWNSYVIVSSLDDALAKVEAAGGHVVMPAMDVMTQGRMAMVADPSGAVIGLWQPIDHQGAEVFDEPGSMVWNELQTRDLEAAKRFYADAFGWEWELSDPNIGYWVANLAAKPGEDKTNGGAMTVPPGVPDSMPSMWFVYFAVEDCATSFGKAIDIGASFMWEPMTMGPGTFAGLVDPMGACFVIGTM